MEKLRSIIDDIQKTAATSNSSLKDVKSQIDRTESISKTARSEIASILSSLGNVVASVSSIAQKADNEEKSLILIRNHIDEIDESFHDLQAILGTINQESASQLATTEGISAKASELNHTIGMLNGIVDQFK